jgi:hypothetical protein
MEGDNPRLVVFVRPNGDLSQMSQWISWDSGMGETTCPQHLARLTRYLDGQLRIYPNASGTIYPQLPPQPVKRWVNYWREYYYLTLTDLKYEVY